MSGQFKPDYRLLALAAFAGLALQACSPAAPDTAKKEPEKGSTVSDLARDGAKPGADAIAQSLSGAGN